jgi:hypothetical protein
MKRISVALAVAAIAVAAGPAAADRRAPGSTFPEQPGDNVQGGCAAILASPAQGLANRAPVANTITLALFNDACFGG